jgi:peptide/nickel transport system permease protein
MAQPEPANPHAEPSANAETPSDRRDTAAFSYWGLIWWRFKRNRIGLVGGTALLLLYALVLPAELTAPYSLSERHSGFLDVPPQFIRFIAPDGRFSLRPFVYGLKQERHPETLRRLYMPNTEEIYPIRFFVRGERSWTLLGLTSDRHLIGVDSPGKIFLLGTDTQGRDLLSQVLYGGRISLTVGLIGVALSLVLGSIVGLVSGYRGGIVDDLIQRGIEVMISFPSIPLWIALSAAIPAEWNSIQVFFAITVILSSIGWGGLARIVRGMTLSLQNEDYVKAGRINGATTWWIVTRHLFPGTLSYMIVAATLAIPGMILGETALSFLGLGIQSPMVSWGVLLKQAQDITVLAHKPWLIAPVFFLAIAVLSFNFLGDGLRDAADPFSGQ